MRMFVPGPVDVNPEVLAAQTRPMLPHRSEAFETLFRRVEEKSRELFYTRSRVFLTASSGTGLQEAAVRNFVNERLLTCVNGAFSARWHDVATSNGKQADRLEAPWGQAIPPEMVADALRQGNYEALLIVHNETSTGGENPVREVAAAARQASPDTLICVDAVSSLGGVKIEMDAWGLDMVLTSSQKCLALPPGLGLAAVSDRAMARAEGVSNRGWYFDLVRLEKHRLKDSTPATPAISLLYALDLQLERILAEEGLENRFRRHAAMASRVQNWALERELGLFAAEGCRSKTVSAIYNQGIDYADLSRFLVSREMRIANGYGSLKGEVFRVAHMGETTEEDIEDLLEALDEYLTK